MLVSLNGLLTREAARNRRFTMPDMRSAGVQERAAGLWRPSEHTEGTAHPNESKEEVARSCER
jgi:hypothetical protein